MTLQIKHLPKAQALYLAIVGLDNEIAALDKKGMRMTDSTETVLMSLTFKAEPVPATVTGEGAQMVDLGGGFYAMAFQPIGRLSAALRGSNKPGDTLNFNLNDTETLYVIDALINCKKVKRRELIQDLKNLGYEL